MSDLVLICENCGSEFLFAAGEQAFYTSKGLATPKLCPICRSIKSQEKRIPPKPIPQETLDVPLNKKLVKTYSGDEAVKLIGW